MKGNLILCGLLVIVLLSTNLAGAADSGAASSASDANLPPEHRMTFRFDAWASTTSVFGQQWDLFQISGCDLLGNPGQPQIPRKVVNLQLPQPLVRVEVRFSGETVYDGVRLAPRPPDYLPGLGIIDLSRPLVDEKMYNREGLLPAASYQVEKLGQGMNDAGQRIWGYNILLSPLRYDPVKGQAHLYQGCEIVLYYDTAPSYFTAARGPAERYIVVTSNAVNASGALSNLVNWKTQKGLSAKVYTVEYIDGAYAGWDLAEKIRNFLRDEWINNSMEWVQLVGDNDTVPVREVVNPHPIAPFDDAWIPTDTYYACLDVGSSWDHINGNHIYGEAVDVNADGYYESNDLDDMYPDVWVARFASSDTSRISTWAQNAVNYEKSPAVGSWTHTAVAVAPDASPVASAAAVKTKVEEYITKSGGYFGYLGELYGSNNVTRLYEANGTLSKANLLTAINGGVAFGVWIGQGVSDTLASSTLGPILQSGDVTGLTNGAKKPVLFGLSSSSGRFDGIECLGEALTENNVANGAMGYVGPARTSQISTIAGYTNNPNATGFQMDFLYQMELGKKVNPNDLYLGRTLGNAKYAFWDAPHSPNYEDALKGFYILNVLGETNCPIWYDTPKDLDPFVRVSEQADAKIVAIKVRNASTGVGLNQSLVCLYDATMATYVTGWSDEGGWINLSIPRNVVSTTIVATRPGWAAYTSTYELQDTWAPTTEVNVTPASPDGKDGWYRTTPNILLRTEDNATTVYNWDNSATFLNYTKGTVLQAPDGDHFLYYYSIDFIGNKPGWASAEFKVDSTIPEALINITPAAPDGVDGWYKTTPLVSFTVNHTGGNAVVKYKRDIEVNFTDYTAPIAIGQGTTVLYYYAEDFAGNREAQRSASFKVDTVAPVSTLVVTPVVPDGNNSWYRTLPSIMIIPEDAADKIFYYWDIAPEVEYNGSMKAPEGVHTIYWHASDHAGNIEPLMNRTLRVDIKAPITTLTTSPASPDGLNGWFISRATITLDPGENATSHYRWETDIGFVNASGPIEVPEGSHMLTFYSNDTAGNSEGRRTLQFKLDTTIPVTTVNITPADKGMDWYTKKPRVKFETETGGSVFYYWDTQADTVQRYSKEFEVPEGEHTLNYYSRDDAGNKEIELTKLFHVDSIAPIVSVVASSPVVTTGNRLTFNLSGTDANGVREYYLEFGDGNNTGWVRESSIEHTYTTPGNYSVQVRGRDPAGNEGRSPVIVVEAKAPYVPPVITPPVDNKAGTNWLLIAGAVVGVVVLVGIVAFAWSRRTPAGMPPLTEDELEERERKKALMPAWGGEQEGAEAEAPMSISEQTDESLGSGEAAAMMPAAASETTPSGARTITCPKCGNEVEADSDYCYICGERWGKKKTPTADADLYKEAPATPQPKQPPAPPAARGPRTAPAAARLAPAPVTPAPQYAPEPVEQAAEVPAEPVSPQAQPKQAGDLDDIMSRLETISKPKPAAPATQPPRHPAPRPQAPAQRPAAAAARVAPAVAAGRPATPAPAKAQTAATAEGGTGKMCPKCGTEMARLVELPGAQNEQLKKLNAKGQHAFQCRNCGHFEISKWP